MPTKKKNPSTGPKTEAGKARSSMNALRHGLYAGTTILPDEDPRDYDRVRGHFQLLYNPENEVQQDLVNQLCELEWKKIRVALLEASLLAQHADDPAGDFLEQYDRIDRIQARLFRNRLRLVKAIQDAKAACREEAAQKQSERSEPPSPDPRPLAPDPGERSEPDPGERSEPEPDDDDRWATKEEFLTQTGREKNYKQAKFFEIWWTPIKGEPEKLLACIYKGRNVDEWPADDQPEPGEVWIRRKP